MNYFILQSLLLIAVAYFLGAMIGCWLRKMFTQSASMLHRQTDDMPLAAGAAATAGAGAIASTRLAGGDGEASVQINRSETRFSVEEPIAEEPVPVPSAPVDVERETISYIEPENPAVIQVEEVVDIPVPVEPEVVREIPTAPVIPAAPDVIDDLTKIKGIGLPIALELKKIGITRFRQVAAWSDEDVAEISRHIGFSGRIERENWMDQAKILASGDDLQFTTHQFSEDERGGRGPRAARSDRGDRQGSSQPQGDDLSRVRGISGMLARQLNEMGITRYAQIAAWNDDEVAAVSRRLNLDDRIGRENWIEQARVLDI